jgi:hypothetical protein
MELVLGDVSIGVHTRQAAWAPNSLFLVGLNLPEQALVPTLHRGGAHSCV